MAKKELVSFLNPEDTPAFGGVIHFKNPRYFYEHESVPAYCTHFVADDERVRKAYLKAGKIEYKQEKSNAVQKEEKEEQVVEETNDAVTSYENPSPDEVPNVDSMTWPELKSYASKLTDEKIKNKKMALEVIEELG